MVLLSRREFPLEGFRVARPRLPRHRQGRVDRRSCRHPLSLRVTGPCAARAIAAAFLVCNALRAPAIGISRFTSIIAAFAAIRAGTRREFGRRAMDMNMTVYSSFGFASWHRAWAESRYGSSAAEHFARV